MGFYEWVGVLRKALRLLAIGWGGGGPDGAGHAASTPPGPGPAAGGWAFGRLRSNASQAKRPHPCKLDRRIHAPHGPAPPGPPPPTPHPPSAVGWLLEARAEAVRTNGPHPPKQKTPQQRRAASEVMNPRFCPRFRAVRPRPRETVREGERGLRRTVGAMDGAIEPPGMGSRRVLRSPLSPSKPIATRRR